MPSKKANAYLVAVPSWENEVYGSAVSRNISSEIKRILTVMWIMSIGADTSIGCSWGDREYGTRIE